MCVCVCVHVYVCVCMCVCACVCACVYTIKINSYILYVFIPIRPHQIYHVTVMPCFDKKLEASRNDFYNDLYKTRDVDCVITSGEEADYIL